MREMSASENFVLRWARLKRRSENPRSTEPIGNEPSADASAGAEAASAHRRNDEIIEEPFDPASLPPIETITVNTDIRGFLQTRVPAELTRAALRRAWASDPAIRDFIGIAENQWDFNDPNAIPGFGPLEQSDNAPARLATAIATSDKSPESSLSAAPRRSAATAQEPIAVDRTGQQAPDELPSANTGTVGSSEEESGAEVATAKDYATEEDDRFHNRRRHGSALPQ
jgi:hypothetical protein